MDVKRESSVIGTITSGTFSPSLKKGIALALLSPDVVVGDQLIVDVRGRDSICIVVELPMVESHVR
jgi:aminomethyltransferase